MTKTRTDLTGNLRPIDTLVSYADAEHASELEFCLFDAIMTNQQELDVSEDLLSARGCRGRGLSHRLLSPWASILPISYPV